jgi:hypothetical protein
LRCTGATLGYQRRATLALYVATVKQRSNLSVPWSLACLPCAPAEPGTRRVRPHPFQPLLCGTRRTLNRTSRARCGSDQRRPCSASDVAKCHGQLAPT